MVPIFIQNGEFIECYAENIQGNYKQGVYIMFKKIFCLALISIVMLLSLMVLTACNTINLGSFYSLQQAYDEGLLTMQDLENIAKHHNNGTMAADILSGTIEKTIKEAAAEKLRNEIPEAKAEDFVILHYYGTYSNSIAIIMNAPHQESPSMIIDEWVTIAGVSFHYIGHNKITIWKQK